MIDPKEFADKQLELAAEFAQYLVDHPEVDEVLPEKSHIYFEIEGEPTFNQYSQQLADLRRQKGGEPVIRVWIRSLGQPQGSRLLDLVIEPRTTVA